MIVPRNTSQRDYDRWREKQQEAAAEARRRKAIQNRYERRKQGQAYMRSVLCEEAVDDAGGYDETR